MVKCTVHSRKMKKPPKREHIRIELLKDEEVRQKFMEEIDSALPPDDGSTGDVEQEWDGFKQKVTEISKKVLGVKHTGGTHKKQTPYWTTKLKNTVLEKNKAFRKWLKCRTIETHTDYVE